VTSLPDLQRPGRERTIDALLWVLAAASAGLTLWLSLGPVPPGAGAFPGADKAFHGLAYFVTTLLLLFAAVWRPGRGRGPLARFAPALILAMVCSGLVVEVLQGMLTERRELEIADWVADTAGVLTAAALHTFLRRTSESQRVESASEATTAT
jgi:hypothetical protein